jgi:hypothetical protein
MESKTDYKGKWRRGER